MKLPLLVISLFAFTSCATPHYNARARQEVTADIDQLCERTGMRRVSPIKSVERWRTPNPGSNVRLDIFADNAVQHYLIRFDSKRRLLSFQAEDADLSGLAQGLGFDNVRNSRRRAVCIAAVTKLNSYLHWTYYGRPAIQKDGPNFLVTYETVSEAEQRKSNYGYLDPYVSFLVTPRGTVIATFWGA